MTAPKPYPFHLVTGRDFARSIAWARVRVNPVSQQIRAAICARQSSK